MSIENLMLNTIDRKHSSYNKVIYLLFLSFDLDNKPGLEGGGVNTNSCSHVTKIWYQFKASSLTDKAIYEFDKIDFNTVNTENGF